MQLENINDKEKISSSREKKVSQAAEFKKKLEDSGAFFVYNFHNWDHQTFLELKKNLKSNNGFVKIYKNRIAEKALGQKFSLKNNNAFVFCSDDNDLKNLKLVYRTALAQNQSEPFEWGIYNGKMVDKTTLQSWSKLQGKEQIVLQIFDSLTYSLHKLKDFINQIKEEKSSKT